MEEFFQSPIPRVGHCNVDGVFAEAEFTALSVPYSKGRSLQRRIENGAGISTWNLSVPYSKGRSLQPDLVLHPILVFVLSVPYSKGRSLQQQIDRPLFQGMHLSVPYSKGRSLQQTATSKKKSSDIKHSSPLLQPSSRPFFRRSKTCIKTATICEIRIPRKNRVFPRVLTTREGAGRQPDHPSQYIPAVNFRRFTRGTLHNSNTP